MNLTEWTSTAGDYDNEIQARTGATEAAYGTYTVEWDMKDAAGIEVPDGDYNIRFELTSDNAPQNNFHRATIPFKKTHKTGTTGPVDQGGYTNIILDYEIAAVLE